MITPSAPAAPESSTTFELDCEHTDTFGGQANYCWVDRKRLKLPVGISDYELVRKAKAALGLTNIRGKMSKFGDMWEFRPYGSNTVAFFSVVY